MAVSSTDFKVQYVGNNSAVTPYPVNFYFQDEAWLVVALVDADGNITELTLGDDYAVTGAGDPNGGEITTTLAYDNTHNLTIYRVVPLTQLLDLVYNDRLPAELLELAFDKLTFIAQQLAGNAAPGELALTFPATEPTGNNTTLPAPAARLGTFLYFNEDTGELELVSGDRLVEVLEPQFKGDTGDTGATGPQGEQGPPFTTEIITDATTSRTLALTDVSKYIRFTSGSAITLTIPVTGAGVGEVAFEVGDEIYIRRAGAGAISLSIAGVTVNGSAQLAYVSQNMNFCLKHLGNSVWDFI